jgi:hypothetical protein
MRDGNSLVHNMEELLAICSRSIVAPDIITMEANRIITIMNDRNLEQKFNVEGCETLSLLASSFIRSGYDSFIVNYARKTGINHRVSGFANKDELIKYCEFCVEYGDESLSKIRNTMMMQLEIENRMTKDEICNLNIKKFKLKKEILLRINDFETKKPFCEAYQNLITVQDQITNYIKLSLLVNSLKKFFKEYYKGLN